MTYFFEPFYQKIKAGAESIATSTVYSLLEQNFLSYLSSLQGSQWVFSLTPPCPSSGGFFPPLPDMI